MVSTLSLEIKRHLEEMLAKAEPLPEDDPYWDSLEGGCGYDTFDETLFDRANATLAKKILEGRL